MTEQAGSFKENTSKENRQDETGDLDYGYDFFPDRRDTEEKKGFWGRLSADRSRGRKLRCYANVNWCLKNSEYIRS